MKPDMLCWPSGPDVEFKPFSGNMLQGAHIRAMLEHATQYPVKREDSINTTYSTVNGKSTLLLNQLDSDGFDMITIIIKSVLCVKRVRVDVIHFLHFILCVSPICPTVC